MICGGLLTSCGQSPRLSELANMECENSPSNARAICIWNGSVVYVIRHHKSKRTTNHEFNVVRFLPARLGMVMVRYLSYIRRLASILRFEINENTKTPHPIQTTGLLFHRDGNPWSVARMTAILNGAARQVWNQRLTSRIYRQIAIGITERHVREVYTPFNRFDEHGQLSANLAFSWQSGHRQQERLATYGLDGAYPHKLQPSLLRAYERVSTLYHEFIHQASKASASDMNLPAASKGWPAQALPAGTLGLRSLEKYSLCYNQVNSDHTLPSPSTPEVEWPEPPKTSTPVSSTSEVVRILPQYQVIICLHCKAGISPGASAEHHFRNKHKTKGNELKTILQTCAQWNLLDPRQAPMPSDGAKPIPDLPVRPGYRCRKCTFMSVSRKKITLHRNSAHQATDDIWEEVYLQTFMTGANAKYWVVHAQYP